MISSSLKRQLNALTLFTLLGLFTTTLRAELVAYWPFNDSASLGDDAIGTSNLTSTGDAQATSSGKFGGGLLLDGAGDFLSGTVNNLPTGDSPYTLSAWFKTSLGSGGLIGWGNYGTSRQVNALRLSGNGLLNYWWGSDLFASASPNSILDDQWHHAAVTYDGTTRRLYIDGAQIISDNPGTSSSIDVNFRIGSTNFTEYFNGSLDEVALYDHALDASDITRLATATAIVTNLNDSGTGSLRQAIADADVGGTIIFLPSLSGKTITLSGTQLVIDKTITIDASPLSEQITIDAAGNSQLIAVQSSGDLTLHNLTLMGGQSVGGGGAIDTIGDLTLITCTLSHNISDYVGGAIMIRGGSSQLVGCTLSHNFANSGGGAIWIQGGSSRCDLEACTIAQNQSPTTGFTTGGIVSFDGQLTLKYCTVSANTGGIGGGGLHVQAPASADIEHCIIAGNTGVGTTKDDISQTNGTFTSSGSNLIGNNTSVEAVFPSGSLIGTAVAPIHPELTPLGYYGGPTQTMHPLADSPAIQIGANTTRTDQRGFTLVGPPTIGATKLGPITIVDDFGDNVTTTTTLRKALSDLTTTPTPGAVIRFASSPRCQVISLGSQLEIPGTADGLFIDASDLTGGLTLDANQQSRVLQVNKNATAALHGLTLTGGSVLGVLPVGGGGAIYTEGSDSGNVVRLSLSSCTISGNTASSGGGIYSDGSSGDARVSLTDCTLSQNSAEFGGGIYSNGLLGSASLNLDACTISDNLATNGGGGIFNWGFSGSAQVSLNDTILAGNSAPLAPELQNEDITSAITETGQNLLSGDPQLAPLGHYGGPTQTMHPLAGSPAILTTLAATTRTDQRGFTLTSSPTIGAVKLGPITVVNDNGDDLSTMTFRKALGDNHSSIGGVIRFASQLNGATITLGSTQLEVLGTVNGLFIDASDLTNGLSIDANGIVTNHRVMQIHQNATIALHGLTLTGGKASGNSLASNGGAIFVDGSGSDTQTRLSLSACTLSKNSATNNGGGIISYGNSNGCSVVNLTACTLSGNSAGYGGGISSSGTNGSSTVTLSTSTLSGNSADFGGGIFSFSNTAVLLNSCTISGNSATTGGGIASYSSGGSATLALNDTILTGNTAPTGADLEQADTTVTQTGNNLFNAATSISPQLAPLGHYGGSTQTMPPIPGSPAIDAAGSSASRSSDQRGFDRLVGSSRDIGAVEVQGTTDTDAILAAAWNTDADGDGNVFGLEFALGTDPNLADPCSPQRFQGSTAPNVIEFGFNPAAIGKVAWVIERSTNLLNWTEEFRSYNPDNGDAAGNTTFGEDVLPGTAIILTDETSPSSPKAFYRLLIERQP